MIEIAEIPYGSSDYVGATRLRNKVLRIPLGLTLSDKDVAGEDAQYHVCVLDDGHVIGTVILKPLSPQRVKIRQMAIDDEYQGQNLGRRAIEFAESVAKERGFCELEMSARITAQGFYEKLGYHTTGEPFSEVGIPTITMIKTL